MLKWFNFYNFHFQTKAKNAKALKKVSADQAPGLLKKRQRKGIVKNKAFLL